MSRRKLRVVLAAFLLAVLTATALWRYHAISRPDHRLRQGEEALRQGDSTKVERIIRVLEADGYPAHAHLLRGEVFLRRQDNARAVEEFRQIPREQEDVCLAAAPLYGEAALPLDRYEAEGAFLYVLSKRPDDVTAHRGLAEIYRQQNALLRARGLLLELVRLDPNDGRAYRYLAQIDIAYEKYDEGRDHLDQALAHQLSSRDADKARQELAQCLFKRREYDRVLKVLEACPPATRANPEIQRLEAEALWEMGRGAEARQLLDRGLASHPQSLSLLRLRARLHLNDNQAGEAVAVLMRALEIDPHDRESHHALGQAYERLHQTTKAREEFRRAEEIAQQLTAIDALGKVALKSPWDGAVRKRLAAQLRQLGQEQMAQAWERTAAACPPAPGRSIPTP